MAIRDDEDGRALAQLSAVGDDSGPGTSIVGGQPPGPGRRRLDGIPVGVERVLFRAAIDPAFREAVIASRDAATAGFNLTGSERTMLRLAPAAQLRAAISAVDPSPESLGRRRLLRTVAASVLAVAAGTAAPACDPGNEPIKVPPDMTNTTFPDLGVAPDIAQPHFPDLGMVPVDLAPGPDLVPADLVRPSFPDLAVPPDQALPPDLLRPIFPDLGVPPDMAK